MANQNPQVQAAKQLLEQGQTAQARQILAGIIREDRQNIEALYLYSQVARNDEEKERVLKAIIRINPTHRGANTDLAGLQLSTEIQKSSAPPKLEPAAASSSSPVMLMAIGGVFLILVIIAAIFVLTQGDDNEGSSETPPTSVIEGETAVAAATQTIDARRPSLPPSFTDTPTSPPSPTHTEEPSRTPQPSRTAASSNTPISFPTATPIIVQAITLDLPTFSQLFNEYESLSIQAAFSEDTEELGNINTALQAMIQNIQLSNYQQNLDIDPAYIQFLDDMVLLLQQRSGTVLVRQQEVESGTISTDSRTLAAQNRLEQENTVEFQLITLINAATATAQALTPQGQPGINPVTTLQGTPVILPTATE